MDETESVEVGGFFIAGCSSCQQLSLLSKQSSIFSKHDMLFYRRLGMNNLLCMIEILINHHYVKSRQRYIQTHTHITSFIQFLSANFTHMTLVSQLYNGRHLSCHVVELNTKPYGQKANLITTQPCFCRDD